MHMGDDLLDFRILDMCDHEIISAKICNYLMNHICNVASTEHCDSYKYYIVHHKNIISKTFTKLMKKPANSK